MDPAVRKELDTLLVMVGNWKDDMIRIAGGEDGWEFLAKDMFGEIEESVFPYLRRMLECMYITKEECAEFTNQCFQQVERLAEHLKPVNTNGEVKR